jgi:DNA-binding NarL/FixJ family response regulator
MVNKALMSIDKMKENLLRLNAINCVSYVRSYPEALKHLLVSQTDLLVLDVGMELDEIYILLNARKMLGMHDLTIIVLFELEDYDKHVEMVKESGADMVTTSNGSFDHLSKAVSLYLSIME